MRWEFGSVLPADIKYSLAEQEASYPMCGVIYDV